MICLLAATPLETALLRQQLPLLPDSRFPEQAYSCRFFAEEILLLHTGIGIASAASRLTGLLEKITPEWMIAFGCAGCYPENGLVNGDLVMATSENFGDLGATSDTGFIPLASLGLPVEEPPLFTQSINLKNSRQEQALLILQNAAELSATSIRSGNFITVNTVSGTSDLAHELAQRFSGLCENMEGAALAQVAESYNVPLLEIRGISNPCGTRDKSQWDLPAGIDIAQKAVLRLLKEAPRLRSQACS